MKQKILHKYTVYFLRINFNSYYHLDLSEKDDYVSNSISIGTGLFELYLALQSIVRLVFLKGVFHYEEPGQNLVIRPQ